MFYKSQDEVAKAINQIIDAYWLNELSEDNMIETIKALLQNNHSKIFKDNDYTSVIKQKCGKRRLEVVTRLRELA
ncbi:TIGR04540 family protein [Paenibacillus sediminis]